MKVVGKETTAYEGKIFEVVTFPVDLGSKVVTFEVARRSPGVRLLVVKDKQLLLSKEYRRETNSLDYRLPGGKVFDTLDAYKKSTAIESEAKQAALKELKEETGIVSTDATLYKLSRSGATIEWDLYYFIVSEFEESKQQLEAGEHITTEWVSFAKAIEMCCSNQISEDRTVGILLPYLLNKNFTA